MASSGPKNRYDFSFKLIAWKCVPTDKDGKPIPGREKDLETTIMQFNSGEYSVSFGWETFVESRDDLDKGGEQSFIRNTLYKNLKDKPYMTDKIDEVVSKLIDHIKALTFVSGNFIKVSIDAGGNVALIDKMGYVEPASEKAAGLSP